MQTLLQIVQSFTRRTGLPEVASVVGVNNASVRQARTLLEEVGHELATRFRWQALTRKATFTSVATRSQGSIYTIASQYLERIVPGTFYNETEDDYIQGPIPLEVWQSFTNNLNPSPTGVFTLLGDELNVYPTLDAGLTLSFYYTTKAWITSGDSATLKIEFTSDDDIVLLDDELLKLGLRAKWKEEKGLPYAEDMRRFEAMAKDKASRQPVMPVLSMAGPSSSFSPSILVPLNSTIPTT